jgi:plastocyanin
MANLFARQPSQLAKVLLSGILVTGCGGDGGGDGGTPPGTTTAIAKASASGDAQSGTVGQPLANPLQVVVTEDGAASPGATVTWSTAVPGAALAASSTTDANGIASNAWTLGNTSGSQTAQAALSGATGSPITFTATAAPGEATTLADAGGNNQSAEVNSQLASAVQVKASDQFGNGVQGVSVGWAATGGTVSAATVPSNAAGISAVNVTTGSAPGPIVITATAGVLAGSPVTFNATAVAAAPIPTATAVTVGNIFFRSNRNNTDSPAVDTVAAGGTVTWTWVQTGLESHSVRSLPPPGFTSSVTKVGNGQTYSFTFPTAGTYQYDCAVHGSQMTGRIVVR